jgi:hypothetical protein
MFQCSLRAMSRVGACIYVISLLLLLLLLRYKYVCRSPYNRKAALDAGDYGLGFAANSLELGCDCLGDVTYFDAVINNAAGERVLTAAMQLCVRCMPHGKQSVCLHQHISMGGSLLVQLCIAGAQLALTWVPSISAL